MVKPNKKEYKMYRVILERLLESSEYLVVNDETHDFFDVDSIVLMTLEEMGLTKHLARDVTYGFFLSGLPSKVLSDFVDEEKVFKNGKRKFVLKHQYGIHSAHYFSPELAQ